MLRRWFIVVLCLPWGLSYADSIRPVMLAQNEQQQGLQQEDSSTVDPRRAMQYKYMKVEGAAQEQEKAPSFDIQCPNHHDVKLKVFLAEKGWEISPASMVPETFDKGYARLEKGSKRELQASCVYRVDTTITASHSFSGKENCAEDKAGGVVAVNYSTIEGYTISKIGNDEPGVLLGKKVNREVVNNKRLVCTYEVKGLVQLFKNHTADMDVEACRSRGVKISCK